jgi:hypothetical protein
MYLLTMEHILPYSYTFNEHSSKLIALSKWITLHPGTKVTFKDLNDTPIFGIILFGIVYIYDSATKTMHAENGSVPQLCFNGTTVETSTMEELLDAFDKVGTQSNYINQAPITAYNRGTRSDTNEPDTMNEEFMEMDPHTIAFQMQLQNLRKCKKGMSVYYTINNTDTTLNFTITNVQYSFSFHYDIDTKVFSRLVFNQPAPESLLIWLINREWLNKTQSLSILCSWLIDTVSVAEAHVSHDFDFMAESLNLFEIHNIGLDEYDWTDTENVCFSDIHPQKDTIVSLLTIVRNKLEQNNKLIESSHINGIYPIINYYLASKCATSVLNNAEIYTIIVDIVKIITDSYKLEISQNIKKSLLAAISGPDSDAILSSEYAEMIAELMEL